MATISITVNYVNKAPGAHDSAVETDEDTPVAVTLTATDPEDDPLTFTVVDGPSHGALSGDAPNLTYTPDAGYSGPDSLTFRANDGELDSNLATISITVVYVGVRFVRGDANADGVVNIADAVYTVNYLFAGGPAAQCREAADANNDVRIDLADAIWTLQYLFAGGDMPAAPFPGCGVDPDPENSLGCNAFPPCDG